jgi:DNA binding protein, excisionase family
MTESENLHLSFDNLPRSVAELHKKIDRLSGMFEQIISSTIVTPLPEIMTVEDVSAMLCKSVSTIYAMTSEHRIPYRKQGNKLYFLRSEIQSWLMDSVVPKDTPKRRRKPQNDEISTDNERQPEGNPDENPNENSATSTQISSENVDVDNGKFTVSECENIPYSIESRTHSRSGATIFAVLFSKEIEAAGERKFLQTARNFNGYWSDFGKGGYIFNSQQEAENFAKAIRGKEETDRTSPQQPVSGNDGLTATHTEDKPPITQGEQTIFDGNTSCK